MPAARIAQHRFMAPKLVALALAALLPVPGVAREQKLEAAHIQVEERIAASGAEVAVVFRTLDGKHRLEIRPREAFHAASTMKLGVMLELFRQVHAGMLRLEDPLPIRNEFRSMVDGSPFQLDPGDDSDPEPYTKAGSTMTLGELCEAMITRSSNLATNLLMEKLGIVNIRRTVEANGGEGLEIVRVLEDGKAFAKGINNTTTAAALAALLDRIARGKAVDTAAEMMLPILWPVVVPLSAGAAVGAAAA